MYYFDIDGMLLREKKDKDGVVLGIVLSVYHLHCSNKDLALIINRMSVYDSNTSLDIIINIPLEYEDIEEVKKGIITKVVDAKNTWFDINKDYVDKDLSMVERTRLHKERLEDFLDERREQEDTNFYTLTSFIEDRFENAGVSSNAYSPLNTLGTRLLLFAAFAVMSKVVFRINKNEFPYFTLVEDGTSEACIYENVYSGNILNQEQQLQYEAYEDIIITFDDLKERRKVINANKIYAVNFKTGGLKEKGKGE